MEKRTIGKFISALRRANGMTQRELADRLFVSDKTVSRWECDESTPDITLIPVIAELFGVTSDELIRGERACIDRAETVEIAERNTQKTEKSIRAILYERNKRHGNLMLLSFGISVLGLIAAMIANLAFSEGLIGFCLALAFALSGEICGILFARNAFLMSEDSDFSCGAGDIRAFNGRVAASVIRLSVFNLCVVAFCLPIVTMTSGGTNYGLSFGTWIAHGAVYALVTLVISYICRVLWVDRMMVQRGLASWDEKTSALKSECSKKLVRTIAVFLAVEAVLACGAWFNYSFVFDLAAEKKVFYTCEEFKAYVESDVAKWREESQNESEGMRLELNGDVLVWEEEIGGEEYDPVVSGRIYDAQGKLICEYEFIPNLYKSVHFTKSSHDKTPITVITYEAGHDAASLVDTLGGVLILGMAATLVACLTYYVLSVRSLKKKYE